MGHGTENNEYVLDEHVRKRGTGKTRSIRRQVHTSCFLQKKVKNREGKMQDALDETIQNADKAWWRDVKIFGSKDVPWRVKCRRVVDQVYSLFCFESENWCWGQAVTERIRGLGNTIIEKPLRDGKDGGRNGASILHEDSQNGGIHLGENETALPERDHRGEYLAGLGLGRLKKEERGAHKPGTCVCLKRYFMVAKQASVAYAGGPQQPHAVETQMGLAEPWKCIGQVAN